MEKLILLESTSSGITQELTEAKQQLNRSEEEVTKLKEEKAAAEKEKAESDEAVVARTDNHQQDEPHVSGTC